MKKIITLFVLSVFLSAQNQAQNFYPIPTTGYLYDAVAENTPVAVTTNTNLDGGASGYVLNSISYANAYNSTSSGLPNNGIIASGTRTYALQSYTAANVLWIYGGSATGSLTVITPTAYSALSLLAFATDAGASTQINVTVLFTDATTQQFNNLTLYDWYNGTPYIINNLGRVLRTGTGAISDVGSGNPRMYAIDLNLSCANRTKFVQGVIIQNTAVTGPKTCVWALSGANIPQSQYTEIVSDVTCVGGSNGSISVIPSGGTPPFSYTWSVPAPNSATITGLPAGVYSYTASEACSSYTSGVIVVNEPTNNIIPVTTMQPYICLGNSSTVTASGAASYIWSNGAGTSASAVVSPTTNTTYTVTGTTSLGCTVYGYITINVLSLPVLSVGGLPPVLCVNSPNAVLSPTPSGGNFSGNGLVNGNEFSPSSVSLGFHNLSYTYTDLDGCTNTITLTTQVVVAPTAAFFVSPNNMCVNSKTLALTGAPSGGTFSGPGIVGGTVFNPTTAGIGTHTITYTHVNANNCTAIATNTVRVFACVGISESSAQTTAYHLYPNPNNGTFAVYAEQEMEINVINQLGQTVRAIKLDANNSYQVVIEDLSSGLYFVQPSNKRGAVQKVIVTR